MGREVVLRALSENSALQRGEVADEPVVVQGVRLVEVHELAIGRREVAPVAVVPVVLDERGAPRRDRRDQLLRDGRLAAPGASGDADERWNHLAGGYYSGISRDLRGTGSVPCPFGSNARK